MYESLIEKYTNKTVAMEDLRKSELGSTIVSVARRIDDAEGELMDAARRLRAVAAKIEENVEAKAGDRIYSLNAFGEMSGSNAGRVDQLIGIRAERIETLQRLVFLWEQIEWATDEAATDRRVTEAEESEILLRQMRQG
jgi:hypothetical protein